MTEQAKHTPGPWEWGAGDVGQDYSVPYCDVYVDGGNLIIAQVNDRFSRDIGRANARLIAAAPETAAERDRLLAVNAELVGAAEKLLHVLSLGTVEFAAKYGPNLDPREVEKMAAARLAKAIKAEARD